MRIKATRAGKNTIKSIQKSILISFYMIIHVGIIETISKIDYNVSMVNVFHYQYNISWYLCRCQHIALVKMDYMTLVH